MKIEEQRKINEVKEKMLLEQNEMQAKHNQDKKDSTEKNDHKNQELTQKIMDQASLIQTL